MLFATAQHQSVQALSAQDTATLQDINGNDATDHDVAAEGGASRK